MLELEAIQSREKRFMKGLLLYTFFFYWPFSIALIIFLQLYNNPSLLRQKSVSRFVLVHCSLRIRIEYIPTLPPSQIHNVKRMAAVRERKKRIKSYNNHKKRETNENELDQCAKPFGKRLIGRRRENKSQMKRWKGRTLIRSDYVRWIMRGFIGFKVGYL